MAKTIWKDYFTFTKTERISVFILLFIIALSSAGPYYYARQFNAPTVDSALQKQLDALLQGNSVTDSTGAVIANNEHSSSVIPGKAKLFYFDPNKLDANGFKQLGLRDKTIQTLLNYRSKGGHFSKADDIRKVYGLRQEEADRLIPYIRIENERTANTKESFTSKAETPKAAIKKIDINTATEEDFKALPGIGDVLSRRIVKFRNSIHGFKSVDDISKTYGLSDSAFQLILPYLTISGDN